MTGVPSMPKVIRWDNRANVHVVGGFSYIGGHERLQGLTQPQVLDFAFTQVTDAGVKRLQQALPKCIIHR